MVKKILVTGGSGFIGSNLVNHLLQKKYKVINLDKLSYSSTPDKFKKFTHNPNYKFIRAAVACTPGNVVVFKGDIPHKAGQVSRETTESRLSVVYQVKGEV